MKPDSEFDGMACMALARSHADHIFGITYQEPIRFSAREKA